MKKRNATYCKNVISLLLAALLVIISVTGCGTLPGVEETVPQETEDTPAATVLTNVYKGERIIAPANTPLSQFIGEENGDLLFRSTKSTTVNNESVTVSNIVRFPADSSEPVVTPLPDGLNPDFIYRFDGGYVLRTTESDSIEDVYADFSIHLLMDDGTLQAREHMSGFSAWGWGTDVLRDTEGYIYIADDMRLAVLNPDLSDAFSISVGISIYSIGIDKNGSVYVQYFLQGPGRVFSPIDLENQKLGEPVTVPERPDDSTSIEGYFFGDEAYDLYCYTTCGIYGFHYGDETCTLLMDFENSSLSGENLESIHPVGENTFMIQYLDRLLNESGRVTKPYLLFRPTEDMDLSKIPVIELAVVTNSYDLTMLVAEFNKNNTDMRVVTKDYYQYNDTADGYDRYAGSNRLATDILTGLYEPDIIYGLHSDPGYLAILQNDRFLDLFSYLDTDEQLPRADIYGSVYNAFSKDGKLFGLPQYLSISGVIVNREMVGDITGWTADEMLAFIQNLPEGTQYMAGLNRSNAAEKLFGPSGYASFIDTENASCSFASDTFISFLEYIKTLPEKSAKNNSQDHFGPYRTGKFAATEIEYTDMVSYFEEVSYFGEGNAARVGYPTASGKNGYLFQTQYAKTPSFTILDSSENPEYCWRFVRDTLLASGKSLLMHDTPIIRSVFRSIMENRIDNSYYSIKLNGRGSGSSFGGNAASYEPTPQELAESIFYYLNEEHWADFENILNTSCSSLLESHVPEDVAAIIEEEISAYLGSDKSAEACADMIQSRVSIYLAEHS